MRGSLTQVLNRARNMLKRKPRQWKVMAGDEELIAQGYEGFAILYSKGNALMGRIQYARDLYEPKTVDALCYEIRMRKAWTFLDIGANIGLISLALLRRYPSLRIEAFEPGPHQSSLFEKTIEYNHLSSRISLHKTALSDHEGETDFYIHYYGEFLNGGSGDGFIDTGRAGIARKIRVSVQRLDDWWIRSGRPDIKVAKIDTEGSELLILRGASVFLTSCRPSLFVEIWPENMKNYGYFVEDVLAQLKRHNYALYTIEGKPVDNEQPEQFWHKGDGNFIARPY